MRRENKDDNEMPGKEIRIPALMMTYRHDWSTDMLYTPDGVHDLANRIRCIMEIDTQERDTEREMGRN